MNSGRGFGGARLRWAAVFALLLVAVSAAPVLAAPESSSQSGASQTLVSAESAEPLPSPEEFSQANEAAEQEEEIRQQAREEELASPQAEGEREASQTAYSAITAAEAQSLLAESFPAKLQELNSDPARLLSGLEIEKTLGPYAARVSDPEGPGSDLVESSIPIEVGQGAAREPVDLSLERSGQSFVPQNPLTEVQLPLSASGEIKLQDGVAVVDLPGEADPSAHRFGEADLFYPEVQTATDMLVSPTVHGIEIFQQLRSPESPERFRYQLSLPTEARLKADQQGGAEVLSSAGEVIATVPAPSSVDAQGTQVPTTMRVEGETLVLDVPHRSADLGYPILVDPALEQDAGPGAPSSASWNPVSTGSNYFLEHVGSALHVRANRNNGFAAASFGQFVFAAPGTTGFIRRAIWSPIVGVLPSVCVNEREPHGYVGIFNVATNLFEPQRIYSPISEANSSTFDTGFVGTPNVRVATVGVGQDFSSNSFISCDHEIFVGGVTLFFEDPEAPTLGAPTGPPGPVGTAPAQVKVSVSDPGFGVSLITVQAKGSDGLTKTWNASPIPGCTGLRESECFHSGPEQAVTFEPALLPEGNDTLTITARDPGGRVSAAKFLTVTVDRTAPNTVIDTGPANNDAIPGSTATFTYHSTESGSSFECKLDSGAFASCPSTGFTTPILADGAHTFSVRAKDRAGNVDASPASRTFSTGAPVTTIESGPPALSSITVPAFIYSSDDPEAHFECKLDSSPFRSCPIDGFQPESPLADGTHTFAVRAVDLAGTADPTPATQSFTVDATEPTVKIESGPEGPTKDPRPTFTFSASGGTVSCVIEADATALEEPSFGACTTASSQAPPTPLADGAYTFLVRAADAAENEAFDTRSFVVDTTPPQTTIDSGPSGTTDEEKPTFAFSSNEAGASFRCRFDAEAFRPCAGLVATDAPATPLADGPHTFEVRAADPAGNTDPTPAARSFEVETGAPQTTIDSGPEGAIPQTGATFKYSSNEETSFECRLDEAAFEPCPRAGDSFSGLSEGEHRFEVRAIKARAGLIDPTPARRSFIVDTSLPSLPAVSGPVREDGVPGLSLKLEVQDGDSSSPQSIRSGVGAIKITVDGGFSETLPAQCSLNVCPDTATREVQLPAPQVIGTHHYVVEGEDGVGHFSALAEFDQTTAAEEVLISAVRPLPKPPCPETRFVIKSAAETIRGSDCADLIIAEGAGEKTIKGNEGDDVIIGGPSADLIQGGKGNDLIRARRSNDKIFGEEGDDLIYGGIGDDKALNGGEGNDLIDGGPGFDEEFGEAGSDTLRGGQGGDDFFGGADQDTVSFADAITPGAATFPPTEFAAFPGAEPAMVIDLSAGRLDDGDRANGGGEDTSFNEVEAIVGSPFADYIKGSSGHEAIDGGPGADFIASSGGSDTIADDPKDFHEGGPPPTAEGHKSGTIEVGGVQRATAAGLEADLFLAGSELGDKVAVNYDLPTNSLRFVAKGETLAQKEAMADRFVPTGICGLAGKIAVNCVLGSARLGAVVISGGKGPDVLSIGKEAASGPGAFELSGGFGRDELTGGALEELLVDGSEQEKNEKQELLSGGGGDDVLFQGTGKDRLEGGNGDDLLVSTHICEGDSIIGGFGSDNGQFNPLPIPVFADLRHDILGEVNKKEDNKCHSDPGGDGSRRDPLVGIETLEATSLGDILHGSDGANLILGRGGKDVMRGHGGADTVNAHDEVIEPFIDCGGQAQDLAHLDGKRKPSKKDPSKSVFFPSEPRETSLQEARRLTNCPHIDGGGDVLLRGPAPPRGSLLPAEEPESPEAANPSALLPPRISNYLPLDDREGTTAATGLEEGTNGTYEAAGVGPSVNGPGPILGSPGGLVLSNDAAVRLNGATDFVNLNGQGAPSEIESGAYSVALFVKFARPPGQQEYLFSSAEGKEGVFLYREASGKLVFASGLQVGAPKVTSTEAIKDENWHFIAGILDGQTITLNLDGFPYSLGYGESVMPKEGSGAQSLIGAGPGLTDFLAATVDEFLTYEGALSEGEVFAQIAESRAEEPEFLLLPEPETSDADGDGVSDGADNCPQTSNADQEDVDLNGVGDACEPPDADGDGIPDASDNCPNAHNPDQADSNGDGLGDECSLLPPSATTEAASAVRGRFATLNAIVNPGGLETSYQFEYGATTAYGTTVPLTPKSIGSGTAEVAVSEAISGLLPDTTYHYRIIASNEAGETEGADQTFTTLRPPFVTMLPASSVKLGAATLNATVNPEELATTYQFEWGITTAYGEKAPATPKSAGSGSADVAVAETLTGLQVDTPYHYRLVAENADGKSFGKDVAFEAHLPRFEAEAYPASLLGEQEAGNGLVLKTSGGSVSCSEITLLGSLTTPSETATLAPSFSGCTAFSFAGATIEANGCVFVLNPGLKWSANYLGSLDISCPEGKAMQVSTPSIFGSSCGISIPAQTGLQTSRLATKAGSQSSLSGALSLSSIKHIVTKDSGICPLPGVGTVRDATLTGAFWLAASAAKGAAIGLSLTGEEEAAHSPRFETEESPATLGAEQEAGKQLTLTAQGSSAKCSTATASGALPASSATMTLVPSFSGCNAFGFVGATFAANGCSYVLHVNQATPPRYAGSFDVSCPEGKAMELLAGEGVCTLTVGSQAGLAQVELEDIVKSGFDAVRATFSISSLKFTVLKDGFGCPMSSTGTFETGKYTGSLVTQGKNAKAALQGLRVSG